ncbi:MAG: FMN-binding protein, partial [Synergistaceae bacterium]|nr:FMN-binding protein [Synergistaceae bacterium]
MSNFFSMKKRIFIIVSVIAVAGIIFINANENAGTSTGTATADGFGGPGAITVSVSVKDGKISSVNAQGPKETVGIGSVAIEKLPAQMVERNSINVDVMTGATISSTGILKAAEGALIAAGLNPEDFKKAAAKREAV